MTYLDNDSDGSITPSETQQIISGDLKAFHHNVDDFHHGDTERDETELRDSWLQNPVRNWTTERILEWASEIGVQSCLEGIQKFKLTGRDLSHLAVSQDMIKDVCTNLQDCHRLKLRCLEVVLFGHKQSSNFLVYSVSAFAVVVTTALVIVIGYYDTKTKRLNGELTRLAKGESEISKLEAKVEKYEAAFAESSFNNQDNESATVASSKAISEANGLREELRRVKHQQKTIRTQLKGTNIDIELLQRSFEQETQLIGLVRELLQHRKNLARKEANKLTQQRRSMLGVFRLANSLRPTKCETEMHAVLELYESLGAVAKERSERWSTLQRLVGFRLAVKSQNTQPLSESSPQLTRAHDERESDFCKGTSHTLSSGSLGPHSSY
eukprot:gene5824-241_t